MRFLKIDLPSSTVTMDKRILLIAMVVFAATIEAKKGLLKKKLNLEKCKKIDEL